MVKIHCLKCKKDQEVTDLQEVTTKNLKNALKAKCSVCGTKVFKFIKKEE